MRVVDHELCLEAENLQIVKNSIFDYLKGYNCIFTDSGRTSIRLLSQILPSGEVLVPYFSCSSVFRSFRKDIKVVFYRVNRDFSIDVADLESKITPDTKTIYVIHSFGKIQDKSTLARVKALGEKHHLTIVEDTTHSVFSTTATIGDYCVCSLRKWFPAPDGGVIYSKNTLDRIDLTGIAQGGTPQRLYSLILETLFCRGRVDGDDGKPLCDKLFAEGETELTQYGDLGKCFLMSDLSRFLYTCFDVQAARKKRMENHKYLRELLKDTPVLSFAIPDFPDADCPYDLPVYVQNRDKFRQYLNAHGIFPWAIWRTYETEELLPFPESLKMGYHILNLPIDQYHEPKDMEYMAAVIRKFAG